MVRRLMAVVLALTAALAGCGTAPPPTGTSVSTTAAGAGSQSARTTSTPSPSRSSSTSSPTPTRTAPTDAEPLTGRTIVVDPGHNGVWTRAENRLVPAGNGRTKACNTSGTAGGDYAEHTFTWTLADEVADRLRRLGATVVLTRPNDHGVGPCVNVRAKIANVDADLLVSLHADGNPAKHARGYHIIVSSRMIGGDKVERRSLALARNLRAAMDAQTTMPHSTYVGGGSAVHARDDIAGLNLIRIPGVMMELGNMRNSTDLALLRSPEFQRAAARAIAASVVASLD